MGIVESLQESARTHQYDCIEKVWLEIGPFSGVEVEALKFGFDVSTKDTLLEGAELEIIETSAHAWCFRCQKEVVIQQRYDDCPECSSGQLQVTSGEELKIKQIAIKE